MYQVVNNPQVILCYLAAHCTPGRGTGPTFHYKLLVRNNSAISWASRKHSPSEDETHQIPKNKFVIWHMFQPLKSTSFRCSLCRKPVSKLASWSYLFATNFTWEVSQRPPATLNTKDCGFGGGPKLVTETCVACFDGLIIITSGWWVVWWGHCLWFDRAINWDEDA